MNLISGWPGAILNSDQNLGSRQDLWSYYPQAASGPTLPPYVSLCTTVDLPYVSLSLANSGMLRLTAFFYYYIEKYRCIANLSKFLF